MHKEISIRQIIPSCNLAIFSLLDGMQWGNDLFLPCQDLSITLKIRMTSNRMTSNVLTLTSCDYAKNGIKKKISVQNPDKKDCCERNMNSAGRFSIGS
jgi:hypothetical protein